MLYSFKKYATLSHFNTKIFYKSKKYLVSFSIFLRKHYFRALLVLSNVVYANFLNPITLNFFSTSVITNLFNNSLHPSFYKKKIFVK